MKNISKKLLIFGILAILVIPVTSLMSNTPLQFVETNTAKTTAKLLKLLGYNTQITKEKTQTAILLQTIDKISNPILKQAIRVNLQDVFYQELTEEDIWQLVRAYRGEPITSTKTIETLNTLGIEQITPQTAYKILDILDTSANRDPYVIKTKYGYINLRNSPWKIESWLTPLIQYDKDINGIADELDAVLAGQPQIIKIPGYKVILDLGDKKVEVPLKEDTYIEKTYGPTDTIEVNVVPTDRQLDQAIEIFKNLGGTVIAIFKEINAFYGRIQLNKIPSLIASNYIGFVEIHHTNYHPTMRWSVIAMRIGSNDSKLLPTTSIPSNDVLPWTLGYTGDPNTAIAVVDTGIDDSHPLLGPYGANDWTQKIVYWEDFSGDGYTTPVDNGGHGSHCASIAAGNYWSNDYVEWITIARNVSSSASDPTTYYLTINTPGYYAAIGFYYLGSYTTSDILSLTVYDSSNSQLATSTEIYRGGSSTSGYTVEIERAVFYASSAGTYKVTASLGGNSGGYLIITWDRQYPYGTQGSAPGAHAGAAPSAKLVGLRVFNDQDSFGDTSYNSIQWQISNAQTYHVVVSSNSWGGGDDATLNSYMNQLVQAGVVTVVAAGNDGYGANVGSPGSADLVVTVAALNDFLNISSYSTAGDTSTGNTIKPDIAAVGGGGYYNSRYIDPEDSDADGSSGAIAAADSNDADNSPSGGGPIGAETSTSDNFWDIQGTSMATPHVSGIAALVVDALGGYNSWVWDTDHALLVKMIMLMTAVKWRGVEKTSSYPLPYDPRTVPKDNITGYGVIQADAAVMAATNQLTPNSYYVYSLGSSSSNPMDIVMAPKVWAGYINLEAGRMYRFDLDVPTTGDFDLYIYQGTPDEYGQPVVLWKSENGYGQDESITITPSTSGTYYVVVKWYDPRYEGYALNQNYGQFNLTITQLEPPTVSIVYPADRSKVTGPFTLKVLADDTDGTVTKVEVTIDSGTWTDITANYNSTSGYYEYNIDPTSWTDGGHNITVRATDDSGFQSTDQIIVYKGDLNILIVDDDNGNSYETYYVDALTSLGYTQGTNFTVWDESSSTITSSELLKYMIVIWHTSTDYSTSLTTTEQSALGTYLDSGGYLFISGEDIGYDIAGDGPWYSTYLKAVYEADDTNGASVDGVAGGPFAGKSYTLDGPGDNSYPSDISPTGGSKLILIYDATSTEGAAVAYEGDYRLIYFAFNFEAINQASQAEVMGIVLNYLQPPKITEISYNPTDPSAGQDVIVSAKVTDDTGVSSVILYYTVNGTTTNAVTMTYNSATGKYEATIPGQAANSTVSFYIWANDTATATATSDTFYYEVSGVVDTTPPTITITSPTSGDYLASSSVTVTWSASDDVALDYFDLYVDDSPYATGLSASTTSYTVTGLSEGSHTITVYAYDTSGNSNSDSVTITVDVTAPTISISSPSDGALLASSSVTVTWSASDNTGIDHYEIYVDSSAVDTAISSGTTSYTLTLSDGSHTIQVVAVDLAGNSASDTISVTVDTTAPSVSITSPSDGSTVSSSNVTVSWSASDATSGVAYYEIYVDGSLYASNIPSSTTSYEITGLSDGSHTIAVYAYDNAGNVGSSSITITVEEPPSVSIDSPTADPNTGDSYVAGDSVALSWSASDNTGIDRYEVYVDGTLVATLGPDQTNYEITGLGEGNHSIVIRAYDTSGNYDESVRYVLVDLSPPSVSADKTFLMVDSSATSVSISWSGSDSVSGIDHYEVYVGGSWTNVGTSTSYTIDTSGLSDGIYAVYVRAFDKAGHESQDIIMLIVDKTAPTISLASPTNGSVVGGSVIVAWSATDNIAIAYFEISTDGSTWTKIGLSTSYKFTFTTSGTQYVYIRAVDVSGNVAEMTVELIVDLAAPTVDISSPLDGDVLTVSDITVSWSGSDDVGISYYLVRLDDGDWIDVGTSTSYTFYSVPNGVHVVYVLAVDKYGRYSIDSVFVVVDATSGASVPPIRSVVTVSNVEKEEVTPSANANEGKVVVKSTKVRYVQENRDGGVSVLSVSGFAKVRMAFVVHEEEPVLPPVFCGVAYFAVIFVVLLFLAGSVYLLKPPRE